MSETRPSAATAATAVEPVTLPVPSSRDILPLALTVARAGAQNPVGSPCTNVCRLDAETRTYCIGCQRSRAEIKGWKTMDDAAKTRTLGQLLAREQYAPR
ncbi:MAG: DUF1289 domain-containing protein [Janthinobacterium lividum]